MTTPCLTPFPATTPRAKVFAPFVIISDSDDEITTLPVRPSPDRTPALYGYLLDSGDDSSDEDLSETAELLHTQTDSTLVVHPPPTRPLPTSHAFVCRPRKRKEILMRLGYRAAMDQWRVAHHHPPEMMTLHAKVRSLEQHDVVTRKSLRIARGRITLSPLRAKYIEHEVRELREFWVTEKIEMAELRSRAQEIEASLWDLKRHLGT
ncbi:hypothetical protein Tco_1220549 [Tanacetum coccineum]